MADEADIANDFAMAELERAIAAARGIATVQDSANECIECGMLIPSARQIAIPGVQHCVEFASRLEVQRALWR